MRGTHTIFLPKEAVALEGKKKWFPSSGRFFTNLFIVLIGISFYLVMSNLPAVHTWISKVLRVLAPFLAAFALAYILNSPTRFFEKRVFYLFRFRRGLSILTTYLLAVAIISVLVILILPQLIQSIMSLANNLETYLANFTALIQHLIDRFQLDSHLLDGVMLSYQDILTATAEFFTTRLPRLLDYGMAIGNGVISGITAFIASIYMLAGKEHLLAQMRKLVYAAFPKKRASWLLSVCDHANFIFSSFIIGKLLDSVIIGLLCFILCIIIQIPLSLLVGVVIGVTNVIPFFGPIIGAIPCFMVLLIIDPWAALRFLILILALQQFDGNILGPRILGDSTGLSAIWVLVAIVVGGGLFGFAGMLLGVPTFAVIYALTRDWANHRLEEKGISISDIVPPRHKQ